MGPYCRKSLFLRLEMLTKMTGDGDPLYVLQMEEACSKLFQRNESHNVVNEDGDDERGKNS